VKIKSDKVVRWCADVTFWRFFAFCISAPSDSFD